MPSTVAARTLPGNVYLDEFSKTSTNENEFLAATREFGSGRDVETVHTSELSFEPMPNITQAYLLEAEGLPEYCTQDTIRNKVPLLMRYKGDPMMLRDTALRTILDRLRIKGTVLSDIPVKTLAEHLSLYAKYADEKGLMLCNHMKVNGIMGAKYVLMPAEDVMDLASSFMYAQGANFISGTLTHRVIRASWNMGERTINLPINAGQSDATFIQSVDISTSDCGRRSVRILPTMLQKGEAGIGLAYSLPMYLIHKGNSNLKAFDKMLDQLERQTESAMEAVRRLAAIQLQHPITVLIDLFIAMDIPQKYGVPVVEKRRYQWKHEKKTAYDVYSSLSLVAGLMLSEIKNTRQMAEYQEVFVRGLKYPFMDCDVDEKSYYNRKMNANSAYLRKGRIL